MEDDPKYKNLPTDAHSEEFFEETYSEHQLHQGLVHFQGTLDTNGHICCLPDEYADIRSALVRMPWYLLGNINRGSHYITIKKNDGNGTDIGFHEHGNTIVRWDPAEEGTLVEDHTIYRTGPAENLCCQVFDAYNQIKKTREQQEDTDSPHFNPYVSKCEPPSASDIQDNSLYPSIRILEEGYHGAERSSDLDVPHSYHEDDASKLRAPDSAGEFHSRDLSGQSQTNHRHQRFSSSGIGHSREASTASGTSQSFPEVEAFTLADTNLGWITINGERNTLSPSADIRSGPITNWTCSAFATAIHQNVAGQDVFYWLRNDLMDVERRNQLHEDLENFATQSINVDTSTREGLFTVHASRQAGLDIDVVSREAPLVRTSDVGQEDRSTPTAIIEKISGQASGRDWSNLTKDQKEAATSMKALGFHGYIGRKIALSVDSINCASSKEKRIGIKNKYLKPEPPQR